jgi:hypothetical protein
LIALTYLSDLLAPQATRRRSMRPRPGPRRGDSTDDMQNRESAADPAARERRGSCASARTRLTGRRPPSAISSPPSGRLALEMCSGGYTGRSPAQGRPGWRTRSLGSWTAPAWPRFWRRSTGSATPRPPTRQGSRTGWAAAGLRTRRRSRASGGRPERLPRGRPERDPP